MFCLVLSSHIGAAAPSLFCTLPHSAQCHHLQRQHLQQLCASPPASHPPPPFPSPPSPHPPPPIASITCIASIHHLHHSHPPPQHHHHLRVQQRTHLRALLSYGGPSPAAQHRSHPGGSAVAQGGHRPHGLHPALLRAAAAHGSAPTHASTSTPPPAPPAEPFGAPLSHPGLCARLEAASIPPLTSPRAELLKAAPTPPSPGRCCAGDAGDVPNARPLTAPLQWGALRCPPACWRSASPAPSWPQVSIGLRAGGTEGGSANLEGTSPTGPPRTTRSERKPPWGGSALSPPPPIPPRLQCCAVSETQSHSSNMQRRGADTDPSALGIPAGTQEPHIGAGGSETSTSILGSAGLGGGQ